MRIDKFIWDEDNSEHIARHKVTPDEAEEAVAEKHRYLWQRWLGRYCVLGKTMAGRYLFVAFDYYSKDRSAYVATSRDMDDKERKLYKRKV
ncbi:MAG: BrnT family toxin [Elusimicrobia bacterium]|nr:BrnT family toxin [Elusimicrobiota bacterium]MBI4218123.1 BrnT family toxin [Elusimicrobiota bacterium]